MRARTGAAVEVLISDLEGNRDALRRVMASRPEVVGHNVETIPRLYPQVRPVAKYKRSLELLRWAHEERFAGMMTKSSIMLGLGETHEELFDTLPALRDAGCDLLTLGQYLMPSSRLADNYLPVVRYIPPEEFATLGQAAKSMGFEQVASGPFVRSSYHAREMAEVY